jgi:uncharacterized protein GlcG (DUF336 family)
LRFQPIPATYRARPLRHVALLLFLFPFLSGCESATEPGLLLVPGNQSLTQANVETLIAQAVEQAERRGERITVAVTDREGNPLGVFAMTGAPAAPCIVLPNPAFGPASSAEEAIQKARTAAFLSSSQHGFTTLTACFITRDHFPPGLPNLPGGPLFGVAASSLPGGDIQPGGSGLTGAPGGVPVFKNGDLVGGLGVSGGSDCSGFAACLCSCVLVDEIIALGAVIGFEVDDDERGDTTFLEGIRLLFANAKTPPGNFTLSFSDALTRGAVNGSFPVLAAPSPRFPFEGEVVLTGLEATHDFSIRGSTLAGGLTAAEVRRIIDQAVAQAGRTRAAIRRPIGSPARTFISVVDLDGSVLGVWRTPDATLFSFDVSVQKARTVVAFSSPSCPAAANCPAPGAWLGARLRVILGVPANQEMAVTSRAAGFLAQDFFPPGIDEETLGDDVQAGPLFGIQDDLADDAFLNGLAPFGNGITVFPGGIPLYRNGLLVGGIGVSGDGVDQDDIIAFAGSRGFEPPSGIRCDRFFFDGVRLPYVKFPRRPEID